MNKKTGLICWLFGHRPAFGYGEIEGEGYFKLARGSIDGVGREHARLYTECQRCGITYKVGMLHIYKSDNI